jgi:branched-subunit amino acid ABC-type transport system permease component
MRVRRFVDMLIVLCLAMCGYITVSVISEYHRLDVVLGAGEITALLAVWGGELLLIVVRQVLGSDVTKGHGTDNKEEEF